MPPKAKVPKLEKNSEIVTNTKSTTTNCDPENNDQDEASKPCSSKEQKNVWLTFH